jgi:hypothetical protein
MCCMWGALWIACGERKEYSQLFFNGGSNPVGVISRNYSMRGKQSSSRRDRGNTVGRDRRKGHCKRGSRRRRRGRLG